MRRTTALVALSLVAACARGGDPDLLNFGPNLDGPDEFLILPTKPLETPADLDALPPPAPGTANLVDPEPQADAVAALGGRPGVLARPSTDGPLLTYAGRNGVDPTVRTDLAAADLAYRQSNRGRLLERLFGVNRYFTAYGAQSLDQRRALERARAAGIRTPAAPPPAQ